MKRQRHGQDLYPSDAEGVGTEMDASVSATAGGSEAPVRARRGKRDVREARVQSCSSRSGANPQTGPVVAMRESKKSVTTLAPPEKMGGLPLPNVVRELLKEKNILRWDVKEGVYEVLHGDNFERRFNELRKVRSKVKAAGTERPFSRMYNFYILEKGDKWARTGTKFRPRTAASQPTSEILAAVRALEAKRNVPAALVTGSASSRSSSSSRSLSGASSAVSSPRVSVASPKLPSPAASTSSANSSSARPETELRRSRDTHFRLDAHAPAPPSAPRHQPIAAPSSHRLEIRSLGKRSFNLMDENNSATDSPCSGEDKSSLLSEQIARAFRDGSSRSGHTGDHGPQFVKPTQYVCAPAAQRKHEDMPIVAHFQEFHDYSIGRFPETSRKEDYAPTSLAEPIEIDDASSGFPSPECLLGLTEEFSGSPLDLGDPELSLFGNEVDHHLACVGNASKDSALLLDPLGFEAEESWTSTFHNVMW